MNFIERIAGTKHKYKITGRGAYGAYGRKSKGCYKGFALFYYIFI